MCDGCLAHCAQVVNLVYIYIYIYITKVLNWSKVFINKQFLNISIEKLTKQCNSCMSHIVIKVWKRRAAVTCMAYLSCIHAIKTFSEMLLYPPTFTASNYSRLCEVFMDTNILFWIYLGIYSALHIVTQWSKYKIFRIFVRWFFKNKTQI